MYGLSRFVKAAIAVIDNALLTLLHLILINFQTKMFISTLKKNLIEQHLITLFNSLKLRL